jgi:hypothetical protein
MGTTGQPGIGVGRLALYGKVIVSPPRKPGTEVQSDNAPPTPRDRQRLTERQTQASTALHPRPVGADPGADASKAVMAVDELERPRSLATARRAAQAGRPQEEPRPNTALDPVIRRWIPASGLDEVACDLS